MRERIKALCAKHVPFMLSTPAALWQFYFLLIPLGLITIYSLAPSTPNSWGITFRNYTGLFSATYAKIFINSALLAVITASFCLLLAFPVAYYLAVKARRWKNTLLVFIILPSWTSFIIQIYAWFYLLQKRGLFSNFLYNIGLSSKPLSLLNNYGATVLGMTYCFLPFMVLPLYTVLVRMDKKLLEASADLGASSWQTLRNIVFPLAQSGIKTGMILVMVPAFGEFAIPDLMGGFKDMYVGRAIMEKFLIFRDWHSGAAMVILAFCLPLTILALHSVMRRTASFIRLKGKA